MIEQETVKQAVISAIDKTEHKSAVLHWSNTIGGSSIRGSLPVVLAKVLDCELDEVCTAICDMITNGDLHTKIKNIPSPITTAVLVEHCEAWHKNLCTKKPTTQNCRLSLKLPSTSDKGEFYEPAKLLSSVLFGDVTDD
jgi:hypothetical protein